MAMTLSKHFLIINFYLLLGLKSTAATFLYPINGDSSIFFAFSVPLDLPNRNVFFSLNFEANFVLPFELDPLPILNDSEDRSIGSHFTNCTANEDSPSVTETVNEGSETIETTTNFTTNSTDSTTDQPKTKKPKKRLQRPLFSRTNFYYMLMDKFKRSGYEGEDCLLRLICETNSSDLGDINGILGNLIHIVFSPSTSKNEELPLAYYQAEIDGVHDQCEKYNKNCKKNLLDLISKPLVDIITNMMPNK